MGLFDRLLGGSQPIFSRPFHKNQSRQDFREWFAKAPRWKDLDSRITDVLIERFQDNPVFEVFVHLSWETDLLNEYSNIGRSLAANFSSPDLRPMFGEALCANITKVLFRVGCENRDRTVELMRAPSRNQDELKKSYGFAMDAFECSINIQPTFLIGYLQLAVLKMSFDRKYDARAFCNRGLAQAAKMREEMRTVPFPQEMREAFEEGESKLTELLRTL